MKGLFIPEITAEMFRNGCLESIEALMAEGEIYDIDYEPERKKGQWQEAPSGYGFWICSNCGFVSEASGANILYSFCPHCGAEMKGEADG